MSTFIQILTDILNDKLEIPGLRDEELLVEGETDQPGTVIAREVHPLLALKIVRLQTLRQQELDRSVAVVPLEDMKCEAAMIGSNVADMMSLSLTMQCDDASRVRLIERIMVELVREAIPTECERMGVDYFYHRSEGLKFRPIPLERIFA